MLVKTEIARLEEFKPWSGAVYWHKRIIDAGKGEELLQALEDIFPEGMDETALNDLLRFEPEEAFRLVGLPLDEFGVAEEDA